jgi:hypothetical protein
MDLSIKDFDKLDVYSKSSIATIIILIPFWYIFIYLFNKPFYKESDLLLKGFFTFCFSTIWYFFNIFLMLFDLQVSNRETAMPLVFKFAGLRCVGYLSLYILFAFTTLKLPFLGKLLGAFIWLTILHVLFAIVDKSFFRKRSRVANT